MVEHNTELDDLGKEYLPEGYGGAHKGVDALAIDRGRQAKTVYRDPKKWLKKGTNMSDLKGFDTTDAREPKTAQIVKELKGIHGVTTSGEDALIEEPRRFLKYYDQYLSENDKSRIVDFETFLEATEKVFRKDRGLPPLWSNVEGHFKGLQEVFNTPEIQDMVRKNADGWVIEWIMKRKNVERGRAEGAYNRLSPETKDKLISQFYKKFRGGISQLPKTVPRHSEPTQDRVIYWRGGKRIIAAKPVPWTKLQVDFVRNNRHKGSKWLAEYYAAIFNKPRSRLAIQSKMYRGGWHVKPDM